MPTTEGTHRDPPVSLSLAHLLRPSGSRPIELSLRTPTAFRFASYTSLPFPYFVLQACETAELVPNFLQPPFCDFVILNSHKTTKLFKVSAQFARSTVIRPCACACASWTVMKHDVCYDHLSAKATTVLGPCISPASLCILDLSRPRCKISRRAFCLDPSQYVPWKTPSEAPHDLLIYLILFALRSALEREGVPCELSS